MNALRVSVLLVACWLLTGCFQLEGVHVLHHYGENDTGSYRIAMSAGVYKALTEETKFSEIIGNLKKWSRPTTRRSGDTVYLEDNTGNASMEAFYQTSDCKAATMRGFDDCHFAFKIPDELGKETGWSIDWEVVLQPDMKLISSNHQRKRRTDGLDHLVWYFDGNRDNNASIDFVVRVPVAPGRQ
jgi:hypothetical protein